MSSTICQKLRQFFANRCEEGKGRLDKELQNAIENSYPSNHNYSISNRKLKPHRQLARRYKILKQYYPEQFESFVDLSCCKGFFTFLAAQEEKCTRILGIDSYSPYIELCRNLQNYLELPHINYEILSLHELADQVDKWGGPFETVLVINMYQYLYFGSSLVNAGYYDHDEIFKNLRKICSKRVIFSNRISFEDISSQIELKQTQGHEKNYNAETIQSAAKKYFTLTQKPNLGRYPVWVLDV